MYKYSSGQKSPPTLISASVGAKSLKICVHLRRQECRLDTKFHFNYLSKKRIITGSNG